MPDRASRPTSLALTSSLMQDVPGAYPLSPRPRDDDEGAAEEHADDEVAHKSLSQRVYARRAEYVQPKHVRIKVGTWNVAAFKGTAQDVGGWFVGGRGLAEHMTGVGISDAHDLEDVAEQEARFAKKQETLPTGDQSTLPKHDDVGIYVLGLQEVVDVNSPAEALRPYTDPSVATRWKESMASSLPNGYTLVAEQQLIGLLLLVYAAPDVAKDIKAVSHTSVGTGLMGYMGNKGAVTARIVLGETTRLVFVNCHLAAGADKAALERRNWDAQQILTRTRFDPIQDAMDLAQNTGEQIGDEDFAFWCGDLNYRLEGIPGDDVRRLLMLHTRNEYDLSQKSSQKIEREIKQATDSVKERVGSDYSAGSSVRSSIDTRQSADVGSAESDSTRATTLMDEIAASEDPTSLQTTLSSLLPHDELHQQMKTRKAFHDGWREGPITFLPTYKYDPGSVGVFDSSEKKRAPSWCDRILYRTRREKLAYESKLRDEEVARKKDEEMKANGVDQAANDESILYDYDPDKDGAAEENNEYEEYDDAEDGVVITKEGFEDEIELEYYTAHQRVLSSDHKPLDASFMLKYDAIVPELKAKIHAEVARELDKAENEGRPNVTVVVDKHNEIPESSDEGLAAKFEGVWFGDVKWAQSKHRSLTIANTSRVPARFTFIERPVDESQAAGVAPKWLSLKVGNDTIKSSANVSDPITLEPGDTCNVELELRILSMDDVRALNDSQRSLEDILVLRVESGRDHFIPIRGHWQESSLGRSIDKLVRIPEGGIRKLQRQRPDSGKGKVAAAMHAVTAANVLSASQSPGDNASSPALLRDEQREDDPVRFSAPRELFRLTEAVEELSTRVVAEWEMTNPSSHSPSRQSEDSAASMSPPWDEHPGWPFDDECWTEQNTSRFEQALAEATNALDEDLPLEANVPSDLPRLQRLYVLCNLLLLFLNGMPDGIIPTDLWPAVEGYLNECEKVKRKPSIDDQRTTIQEALALSPSHSISFILITSMLERMIHERIADADSTATKDDASPTSDSPVSPTKRAGGILKRMTAGKVPPAPQREKLASAALAKIFAPAVVRVPASGGEKAKGAQERRKVELIEIFLRRDQSLA